MAGWVNALIMATVLSNEPEDATPHNSAADDNISKTSVFSIKGLMCMDHAEKVRSIIRDTHGIDRFELDPQTEYLHIAGYFDALILKDSIEKIGFLVYDEPEVACKVA